MRPREVAFKSLSRLARSLIKRFKPLFRRKRKAVPTRRSSVVTAAARRSRVPTIPVPTAPVTTTPVATTYTPPTRAATPVTANPVTSASPPPRPPHTTLLHLPFELLLEIASYLPTASLSSLTLTSRHLHLPLSHALHRRLLYDKPRLTIRAPDYCSRIMYTIAVSTLQWAAFNGNTTLVQELLDTGVWDVDEVYPEPGYATALRTPLCLAVAQAHVETVRVLLDAGAAVWNAEFQNRKGGRWDSPFGWVRDQMVEGMLRVTYKARSERW
ncbi:hypothetical protein K440DRAFT_635516 [Wilcoxina mikolae CBS 423.85]|nr:hypothetical protein K440DRAFT_635516 [Wilcoxina mikolae CBS 423.85]